jgi:hypothetical protein
MQFLSIRNWKKLSPQTRSKVFFQKEMPSALVKLHFSYLSLHQLERNEPKRILVGMDLLNMTQFSEIFKKNIWKTFLVLSGLPSNEKIYSTHYNSYNEGPNLTFLSFTKIPSNSLPTIEFPKNHITSSYHRNIPKTRKTRILPLRTLGIKVLEISLGPLGIIPEMSGNVVFHYQIPSICLLVKAYFDVEIAKTLISCII